MRYNRSAWTKAVTTRGELYPNTAPEERAPGAPEVAPGAKEPMRGADEVFGSSKLTL